MDQQDILRLNKESSVIDDANIGSIILYDDIRFFYLFALEIFHDIEEAALNLKGMTDAMSLNAVDVHRGNALHGIQGINE